MVVRRRNEGPNRCSGSSRLPWRRAGRRPGRATHHSSATFRGRSSATRSCFSIGRRYGGLCEPADASGAGRGQRQRCLRFESNPDRSSSCRRPGGVRDYRAPIADVEELAGGGFGVDMIFWALGVIEAFMRKYHRINVLNKIPVVTKLLNTVEHEMTTQKRFAAYAWFVLSFAIAVVLWGAGVRATGSGAGCGDQWPLCNGGWFPRVPALHTVVEFTHRIISCPTLGLFVIGLVIFAFRLFPRRDPVRRLSVLVALFTATEALIGAALVLLGQVGANSSPNRAYTLAIHLLNTMVLLAAMALTGWFAGASANLRREVSTKQPVSRSLLVCAPLAFLAISVTARDRRT